MMKKEYNVIVSEAAFVMLDTHMVFLAKVSVNAAKKAKDEILKDIKSLRENPHRFPIYENPFITETEYRKMLSAKRYLIFYEISDKTVNVDYIVDCRQNYEWLIY
ncbi:MAG: type II toxin-antitoxin system RelE/ParE family toxin [Oscillospiraceae bacterium]|nr:type II toxin-antitoxin system RelE/ParE family toxin [Oscillospiraceae bacterium]